MARIAIDLHGGDFGPSVLIPSAFRFFRDHPEHYGVLVGDSRDTRPYKTQAPSNIEWIDADALGDMANRPSRLLRGDGHSSIEVCFRALKNRDVDALVSSEHTGVLLTLVTKYGKLHSLVNRPVLASWLPTLAKPTVMLDLGASFTAAAEQLLVYSAIGAGLLRADHVRPKLALLNVGTESFKGPPELRAAHSQLQQWQGIDYQGFVEAYEVFKGELDVIVCDGFTGNSVIKSAEGALDLTFDTLKNKLQKGVLSRMLGVWLKMQMKTALKPLNPRYSNGALVAGSNLLVVKSHGNAKEKAVYAAISRASKIYSQQAVPTIWAELDRLLDEDWLDASY